MISLGLDISTKTGYAVVKVDNTTAKSKNQCVLEDHGVIKSSSDGFRRWSDMATELITVLDKHEPDIVMVEGYGYANKHTLVPLVTIGTVLRYFLWQNDTPWVEVAPPSLKKFVTGKGNAKKEMILKEVFKRWGHDLPTNDEADAVGLAYMGLAFKGVFLGLPKINNEPLSKLQLIAL